MKRERIIELRKSELGREGIENQYYFRERQTAYAQWKNIIIYDKTVMSNSQGQEVNTSPERALLASDWPSWQDLMLL